MKILYMNDTKAPQYLFLHTLEMLYKKLEPTEAIEVDVRLADDQKIFIKTWGDWVFIGRSDIV